MRSSTVKRDRACEARGKGIQRTPVEIMRGIVLRAAPSPKVRVLSCGSAPDGLTGGLSSPAPLGEAAGRPPARNCKPLRPRMKFGFVWPDARGDLPRAKLIASATAAARMARRWMFRARRLSAWRPGSPPTLEDAHARRLDCGPGCLRLCGISQRRVAAGQGPRSRSSRAPAPARRAGSRGLRGAQRNPTGPAVAGRGLPDMMQGAVRAEDKHFEATVATRRDRRSIQQPGAGVAEREPE